MALYYKHISHMMTIIAPHTYLNTINRYRRLRRKAIQRKEEMVLAAIKIQKVLRGHQSKKIITALKEEKEERRLVLYADKAAALERAHNDKYANLIRRVLRGCMPLRYAFGKIRYNLVPLSLVVHYAA